MASRARDELSREIREWWHDEKSVAIRLPPLRKFWRFVDWERVAIMRELPNLVEPDGSASRIINTILARTVPDFAQWLATWDDFSVLSPLETPDVVVRGGFVKGVEVPP